MNKFLIKAKKKGDGGEWIVGLPWLKHYDGQMFIRCFPNNDDEDCVYVVDQNTFSRQTGQKDKYGFEIWEHDIVELFDEDGLFEVVWNDETSRFEIIGNDLIFDFDNYWGYQCEVLGNRFDMPWAL